jgi:medium-chain acyl-[acyl-carrier-protein] hydrolase
MAAAEIKVDVHSIMKQGYVWMLVNVKMSVNSWPKLGEKITIRTWHSVTNGLYTFRAFDLRSDNGKGLMNGSTSWILLDIARTRPVKPKINLPQTFVYDGENNPPVPSEFSEIPKEHSGFPENSYIRNFKVRLHDLDANDHVNNAVYIEWAVESVPKEIFLNYQLSGWDVTYRRGAYLGDEVIVNTQEELTDEINSPERIFTGIIKTKDAYLCTVRSYWRSKQ